MRLILAVAALLALASGLPAGSHAALDSRRLLSTLRRELISNGSPAPPGRFPYMCALGRAARDADTVAFSRHFCGGTLIHPQVVVTAAHCTADARGRVVRGMAVLCNTTLLGSTAETALFSHVAQGLLHPTSKEVEDAVHRAQEGQQPAGVLPGDDSDGDDDDETSPRQPEAFAAGDVALLLLETPFEGAQTVQVATTPQFEAIDTPGTELRVAGWGATSEERTRSSFPRTLQEGTLPLVDPDRCARLYRRSTYEGVRQFISGNFSICAGFTVGAKTLPCGGDSGGPLLYTPDPDDPSTHIQVGIVSGGAGECGGPALPGVFLRLDAYRPWIEAALQAVDATRQLPAGAAAPGDMLPVMPAMVFSGAGAEPAALPLPVAGAVVPGQEAVETAP